MCLILHNSVNKNVIYLIFVIDFDNEISLTCGV